MYCVFAASKWLVSTPGPRTEMPLSGLANRITYLQSEIAVLKCRANRALMHEKMRPYIAIGSVFFKSDYIIGHKRFLFPYAISKIESMEQGGSLFPGYGRTITLHFAPVFNIKVEFPSWDVSDQPSFTKIELDEQTSDGEILKSLSRLMDPSKATNFVPLTCSNGKMCEYCNTRTRPFNWICDPLWEQYVYVVSECSIPNVLGEMCLNYAGHSRLPEALRACHDISSFNGLDYQLRWTGDERVL